MAQNTVFVMKLKGKCNGVNSYEKNGQWYHSAIILIEGEQQGLSISLKPESNPINFQPNTEVEMMVKPRFYNGRLSGLQEA